MNPFALPFMQTALAASLLAGTALACLGVFMTAKRVAFSGLAAAQLSGLGTVIGVVLGFHFGAAGFAVFAVGTGMFLLARLSRSRRAPPDAWVACLYVLGAGLSVLILSKAPRGESETMGLFFGNILSLTRVEVWESLGLFLGAAAALGLWFHRWIWISFDAVSAEVAGLRVNAWNFLFHALFALAMTLAIHIFGVLLAFAYLILPAAAGFMIAKRLGSLFIFVPLFTVTVTLAGFYASFRWDFPTGPFIACLLAVATLFLKAVLPTK